MASRTALVLETNPVITERYLDYTHDSDWRIMLKDTLNGFLEKLQQEKFNLIVAEESLVPQGIIQMMKATGIPLLLSSNTKNSEIQTLPRNFNRTELLTVFDRLVPPVLEEFNESEDEKTEPFAGNDEVHSILSDLEDEDDDFFELSSNDVVLEPSNAQSDENANKNNDFEILHDSVSTFETNNSDGEDFMTFDSGSSEETPVQHVEEAPKDDKKSSPKDNLFAPPPSVFDDSNSEIDDLVNSLSVDFKPKETEKKAEPDLKEEKSDEKPDLKPDRNDPDDFIFGDNTSDRFSMESEKPHEADHSEIKAAVAEWLDKNARGIIKEIVLEELASLSGKNND